MKRSSTLIILLLLFVGCQTPEVDEPGTPEIDVIQSDFPSFDQFPTFQFRQIQLGNTIEQTEVVIASMPVEVLAQNEVGHYYLPSDSTEFIIPTTPTLNEFKVFLRSKKYLDREVDLINFFTENAVENIPHPNFNVYLFETETIRFKLTSFKQENSIRLHYILVSSHS